MKSLLLKELKLTASPLSYLFISFCLMTLIPGYPILVGAFFICFGIFHSFQSARENNDILYTALLPVKKTDAVSAKYAFAIFIQMAGFLPSVVLTIIRMTLLKDVAPYVQNAMMNANQAYLGWMLVVFALFNLIFIPGFFKTAYQFGKPFILFGIAAFLAIGVAETIHHFPGLTVLNDTAPFFSPLHWGILTAGILAYVVATIYGLRLSQRRFSTIDL